MKEKHMEATVRDAQNGSLELVGKFQSRSNVLFKYKSKCFVVRYVSGAGNRVSGWVCLAGSSKEAEKYTATVDFFGNGFHVQGPLKVGIVDHLRNVSKNDVISVEKDMLFKMVDKEKNLRYKVTMEEK